MTRRSLSVVFLVAVFCAVFGVVSILNHRHAGAAINPQINFQGKLTNPDGTNVTNGSYSIRFRIYTDPTLDAANPCVANTCKWEETQAAVSVTDGIFQVALGSVTALPGSVDFNTSGLYLGIKVSTDLEMTPRIQFTASPYAFNSSQLNGLSSTSFVQLAQGVQTDSSTANPSIFINKTGITAKILELQRGGVDVLNVNNDGSVLFQNSTNSATAFQVQNAGGEAALTVNNLPINNIISNSSFEINSNGWAGLGVGNSVSASSPGLFGAQDLSVSSGGAAGNGTKYTTGNTNPTQLAISTTYIFSWYAKITGGTFTDMMGAYARDGSTETNCTNINTQVVVYIVWTRFSCTVTTDGTSPSATAYLAIKHTGAVAADFQVDGVQVENNTTVVSDYQQSFVGLNGVISTPGIFRSQSSNTAFAIQNTLGANAFAVDTTPLNTFVTNAGMDGSGNFAWALKAGSGTVSRDSTQQFSGVASEKVALTSTAIGDGAKFTVSSALLPTTLYAASFTIKQTAGTAFGANLEFGLNSGADIPCTLAPTLAAQPVPTTGWARYSCTFNSDASPTTSDFLYWKELDAPGVARTFFIDSVQIEPGSNASVFEESAISLNGIINSPVAIKSLSDSISSLLIQNTSGVGLFQVDSLNARVYIGGDVPDSTGVLLVLDSKNTTGDPAGVNGGSYYNSDDRRSRCYENNQYVDCRGTSRPNSRRWALIEYPGTGAAAGSMTAIGDTGTGAATTFSAIAASATEPTALQMATSNVANNQAGLLAGNVNYLLGGRNVMYQAYVSVQTTTLVRVWAGMTNQTAAVMGAAANPAGRYAAFRYDTGAGDANWQCITKDNATQNIQNSGVAIGTAGVKLEILENGTTDIIFRINGVRVCTNSANLPGANILARRVESVTTLSAAIRSLQVAWVYVESDR